MKSLSSLFCYRWLFLFARFVLACGCSASFVAASAASFQITDGLGRTVTFDRPAKTAVYLGFYEAIPALKIWEQTSGLSRFAFDNALLRASHPGLDAIANVGSASDIHAEKLVKLRPDVVITRGDHPALVTFMAQKGLKVLAFNPHTLEDVWRDLRIQGAVMGKPEAAEKVVAESKKMIGDVRIKVRKIAQPKTVLWLWSKPTRIVGKDSVTADIMRLLQVQHPGSYYAASTPEIGLEKIVKLNPDVILIWGAAKYSEADILNNPQWRSIKAVRNKQVFKAPNWGVWSPQAASLTLWAATRIYPEHFDTAWSQARIEAFHQNVFSVTVAK